MKVNSINNQTFEANKLRIPVKNLQTRWGSFPIDCVKEFDNPKAEELYKQLQQAKSLEERIAILSQIGHYRIIDKSKEKLLNKVLSRSLL